MLHRMYEAFGLGRTAVVCTVAFIILFYAVSITIMARHLIWYWLSIRIYKADVWLTDLIKKIKEDD